MLLVEDIWKLSQNLNIYHYCHIYKKANKTTNCLTKKDIYMTNSNVLCSGFPNDVKKFAFEYYYEFCNFSYFRSLIS